MPLIQPDMNIQQIDSMLTPAPIVRTVDEMQIPVFGSIDEALLAFNFVDVADENLPQEFSGNYETENEKRTVSKATNDTQDQKLNRRLYLGIGLVNDLAPAISPFEYSVGVGKGRLLLRAFYSDKDFMHNTRFEPYTGSGENSRFTSQVINETSQQQSFSHYGVDGVFDLNGPLQAVLGIGRRTLSGEQGTATDTINHYRDGELIDSTNSETPIPAYKDTATFVRFGAGAKVDLTDRIGFEVLGMLHAGKEMTPYYVIDMGAVMRF